MPTAPVGFTTNPNYGLYNKIETCPLTAGFRRFRFYGSSPWTHPVDFRENETATTRLNFWHHLLARLVRARFFTWGAVTATESKRERAKLNMQSPKRQLVWSEFEQCRRWFGTRGAGFWMHAHSLIRGIRAASGWETIIKSHTWSVVSKGNAFRCYTATAVRGPVMLWMKETRIRCIKQTNHRR